MRLRRIATEKERLISFGGGVRPTIDPGMFLHMGIGKPGRWSAGNSLAAFGTVLLAAAVLTPAVAVITT
jgi:hypothetical protein